MAKQIIVSFSAVGASCRDSDAAFLAEMGSQLDGAIGADRSVGMFTGSALRAAQAVVQNADSSQDAADALAQAAFDVGVTGTFAASEIDAAGSISELTAPTPS
jgi:hypothetical protein